MGARQYAVVIIGGEGDPLTAASTALVAALLALGVRAVERCPFVETVELINGEPKREHSWHLEDSAAPVAGGGRVYHTAKLREQWGDAAWLALNYEHPLARIRAAFHDAGESTLPDDLLGKLPPDWLTRAATLPEPGEVRDARRLLELLRAELGSSVPLMVVRKGKRRVLIPVDATPEEEAELLSKLDPKQ